MTLEEALDALSGEGYKDIRFVALPSAADYQPGRIQRMVWVCEGDPYPGDPQPLYAWGATRTEAARTLFALITKVHPPNE